VLCISSRGWVERKDAAHPHIEVELLARHARRRRSCAARQRYGRDCPDAPGTRPALT
jgi:hypothetical protein